MKNLSILILSLTISVNICSQNIRINNDLNKFIGTWRSVSGTDTTELVLQKQVYQNSYEMLVGWHRYVKNGVLIQSSFQYIGRDVNIDFYNDDVDLKTTLRGFTRPSGPKNVFFNLFFDLTLHKPFEVRFNMLANSTTQASWKITKAGANLVGKPAYVNGCTLPINLIFNKL